MDQSLNIYFDSFVDNFFGKSDTQNVSSDSSVEANGCFKDILTHQNNIVNLTKLVMKELFKHRSKVALTAECRFFFDHLFILLEKFLLHGLKQRKQLFGKKIDAWSIVELIEKFDDEAKQIIESIRSLPKTKTSNGRVRAWLRLATTKKKLSNYFEYLVVNRDSLLKEYYEKYALIYTENANILSGLLVGLNSFDYDVFLKDESFDNISTSLDLECYLKETLLSNGDDNTQQPPQANDLGVKITMDQNKYLEEMNQNLMSQIKDLKTKLKHYSTAAQLDGANHEDAIDNNKSVLDFGTTLAKKEKQLLENGAIIERLQSEVAELNCSLETKDKMIHDFETDAKEKGETIVILRSQLDEIKAINLQLFTKMQDKENELNETNKTLQECYSKIQLHKKEYQHLEKKLKQANETTCDKELLQNYQLLIDEQQEQMTRMQLELEEFKSKSTYSNHLREAFDLLKKKHEENELSLEEIGKQLQDAKLEIESLREYNGHLNEASWINDSIVNKCKQCLQDFTFFKRKHHCRCCGSIYCAECTSNEMPLPSYQKKVRVCDSCYNYLLTRYNGTSCHSNSQA